MDWPYFRLLLLVLVASVVLWGVCALRDTSALPPGGCPDYDHDARITNADVYAVVARYGKSDAAFDQNGDGYVSIGDVLIVLDQVGGTCACSVVGPQ